ncbi:MAG: hypothetical protein EA382_09620 [Spirochaetaceae bacterium]|nr:MAG: hypothetical protein EA382_09620 [Spirochaetaceae bacterium]
MKRALTVLVFVGVVVALGAQPSQWEFGFGPRIIGATVAPRYTLQVPTADGVETSITGLLSGAYQASGYYRAPDGSYALPADVLANTGIISYNRADFTWELGVLQGIVPRGDVLADAASVFLFYRGHYQYPFADDDALFFQSNLPETAGSLRGSFVSGVAYNRVTQNRTTRVRDGVQAEVSIEWGPSFLHNQIVGTADYGRWNARAAGFLPLYELAPLEDRNRLSVYAAGFAAVDWATGPAIPETIRASIGGRQVRSATGGSVRGYGGGRFDATFKSVANAELRVGLPAIVLPAIVPGLVIYTDAGYYADGAALSPVPEENDGFLLSSGVGASIDLFDAAVLVFYTSYLWTEPGNTGERWVPFAVGFGFHF